MEKENKISLGYVLFDLIIMLSISTLAGFGVFWTYCLIGYSSIKAIVIGLISSSTIFGWLMMYEIAYLKLKKLSKGGKHGKGSSI